MRDAEIEGRAYPTTAPPDKRAPAFLKSLPAAAVRECVRVPNEGLTRSGEMVTQVLYLDEEKATGKRGVKMPWAPLHLRKEYFANEGEVSGVIVRVASLQEPSRIEAHEFSGTTGFAEMGVSYPTYVPLPGEGPWRLIATSGPDWGCFDLKAS